MTTRLEPNGPWDRHAALALLVAHTVPGAETTERTVHRRLLRIGGELVPVAVDLGDVPALTTPAEHLDAVMLVVRRWFELDADQTSRNAFLTTDPLLAPLITARPGLRVTGHPDPFEALVGIVIGQQVSLAAARTVTERAARERAAGWSPHRSLAALHLWTAGAYLP